MGSREGRVAVLLLLLLPPPLPLSWQTVWQPPPLFGEGKPGQGKGIQGVANREATCAIYQQGKGRVLQEAAVISSDIPIRPSLLTNHTTHPPSDELRLCLPGWQNFTQPWDRGRAGG